MTLEMTRATRFDSSTSTLTITFLCLFICAFSAIRVTAQPAGQQIPDLEGIWSGDRVRGPGVRPRAEAVVTAAGREKQETFELLDDPAIRCQPNGLVRQAGNPYPMEIIQYDDRLTFRYEEWTTTRTVYTDGRSHPDDAELTRLGHSIGWVEGQTLVVDTTGITPHLANNRTGLHTSESLRVTERYTRQADERFGSVIDFEMTIEDPIMLAEPYIVEKVWSWAPDLELLSYDCIIRERPSAAAP
jgi:hypothetical protein